MINTEKRIVISTSLKNFGDNENSRIQHLFLDSLEKQKYSNFEVVICLFNQPEIKEHVKKYKFKKTFIECELPKESKVIGATYSFFSWISDSMNYAVNSSGEIYVFSFADYIFENNFLDVLNKEITNNVLAISYPIIKRKFSDLGTSLQYDIKYKKYIKNEFYLNPNIFVNENFFLDINLLRKEENKLIFNKYNFDPLQGINFAQLFNSINCTKKNIYFKTKQTCVYNNYNDEITLQNHKASYLSTSDKSHEIYTKIINYITLDKNLFYGPFRKINNVSRFKIIGSLNERFRYSLWIYNYYIYNFAIKLFSKIFNFKKK